MDKVRERKQLSQVFGARSSEARDHERPDFLFDVQGRTRLGIETTTIYASNTDAKLALIPDYSETLLSKTQQVHRKDKGTIKVENLSLFRADGTFFDKMTGIIQQIPSRQDAYRILFEKIEAKEGKTEQYLRNCAEVDLIVEDGSNLFRHKTHEEFYKEFHVLAPKIKLIRSRFREIHLIASTTGFDRVYIPLIANTFFADCVAYEYLLQPSINADRSADEIFQLLAACLWHDGYATRVKMTGGPEGVGISCGAWEILYAEDGKKLRDWNFPFSQYVGESLAEVVAKSSPSLVEEAQSLSESRTKFFASMDVRLPTHQT